MFWSNPASWPVNSTDHVFLARAVHRVGRAIYSNQWTGQEPAIPWDWPLPSYDDPSMTMEHIQRAQWILLLNHEGYRNRATNPALMPVPTANEWAEAKRITDGQHDANWPAYARFAMVTYELTQLFEAGRLPTGVREPDGGEVSSLHRSYWNGESVVTRFVTCRIHPARPFDWTPAGQDGLPLFVERAPLEKYLALLMPALAAPVRTDLGTQVGEHASEYLRFMIEQSIRLKLSPQSEPKHSELVAILGAEWGAREPSLSSRLLKAMATLMRSPEAQEGRARRRPKG